MLSLLSGPRCSHQLEWGGCSREGEKEKERDPCTVLRIAAKGERGSEQRCALEHSTPALTPTRTLAQARSPRDDGQGEHSTMCLQNLTAFWSEHPMMVLCFPIPDSRK